MDTFLSKWYSKDAPGMVVLLAHDGRIDYRKGFGLANLESRAPLTSDSQFQLGSMTKQFTATAIMILAEQGKLHLDDSLDKFCPEFPDYARMITVRHLLNHTSGMPKYEELLVGQEYEKENFFRSSKSPPVTEELPRRLRSPPDDRRSRANEGYFDGMRAIEGSSSKTKHAPVSVRTNASECPLNVDQELEATATGASLPDVTLTGFEDELTTTRSNSLPEVPASLQGFAFESGKVVGFQRAPISLASPGRIVSNWAAT